MCGWDPNTCTAYVCACMVFSYTHSCECEIAYILHTWSIHHSYMYEIRIHPLYIPYTSPYIPRTAYAHIHPAYTRIHVAYPHTVRIHPGYITIQRISLLAGRLPAALGSTATGPLFGHRRVSRLLGPLGLRLRPLAHLFCRFPHRPPAASTLCASSLSLSCFGIILSILSRIMLSSGIELDSSSLS